MSRYGHIMVGAGSARCVVAARLSENADNWVLLPEAGKDDSSVENVHVPPARLALLGTEVDWAFETTPQPGTKNLPYNRPRGKELGGARSINAMVYLRRHRNDFDNWATGDTIGWDYEGVLSYFRKMETAEGDPEYRGTSGPMQPKIAADATPLSEVFLNATKEPDYPRTDDFNDAVQEGAGSRELTAPRRRVRGRRSLPRPVDGFHR